ncbi:MAG: plasmid pRiA4b ORF-3 family protein [Elusimicrobia bacterium]|nr:plasmid pRiA4b ORF-3 family protein [Elusimicrobiota bacterium]
MAKEALKIWMELPSDIRSQILSNVWCSDCKTAVAIRDYNVEFSGGVVVLHGFCATCGHKVAYVLDGCQKKSEKNTKKSSQKPKRALKYFIFNVWLYDDYPPTQANRIIRKIQIAETKSLYNFAKVITQAFDFYFDHCFGFYNDLNRPYDSEKAYELFYDLDDVEPPEPHVKSVKRTKIQQVFKRPGDKMLFLFDYGDSWQFNVELEEILNAEKWDLKPLILESIGKAPLQYPPCEDELEDEE